MPNCLTFKKAACKNCYKCIRHCPVKSIRFSENQAHIIGDECILCGQCFVVCPQNAKEIAPEIEKVKEFLKSGAPVFVSMAPSFVANYEGVGIGAMRRALQKLGFCDVEETARGAAIVKTEYERLLKTGEQDVIITSCCPAVNLLIQKHYPEALPFLADVVSPMQAHCMDIKARHPDAKTVFVGPCVAKKDEAARYEGIVDAVLTFEELTEWLQAEGVEPEREQEHDACSRARLFPTTGGVLKAMTQTVPDYTYLALDGVENCVAAIKDIQRGKIHKCFIEMSACTGSCVGGPVMEKYHRSSIVADYVAVTRYAGEKDFEIPSVDPAVLRKRFEPIACHQPLPTEAEIRAVLCEMGKFEPEQELNCGSCGYDTCREKAVAIIRGKAEISMCLPYLKEKAENFSNIIVNNTPNGLIVLNERLEIQQINTSARNMLNIPAEIDVLGEPIAQFLDPALFEEVLKTGENVREARVHLAAQQRYVEQSVVCDKESRLLVSIMRDVTNEQNERAKKEKISRQTVEVADKVVDKQMRIVQEIASLLGETAAETKIALAKLKESIQDE